MKPTYLIFLDFDGVLIHEKGILKNGHDNFDDDSVSLLKDLLLDETQPVSYQVVISSAHRLGRTLEELKDLFKPYGLENRIVGFTPDLGFNIKRGYEIHEYLKQTPLNYRDFVIVDDEKDMGDYINRLIQTNVTEGLNNLTIDDIKQKVFRLERMHNARQFSGRYIAPK